MLKDKYTFNNLVEIIKLLRSPNGCAWDREQTHESLKKNLIEEAYEVLEVIDLHDNKRFCEELGDLLLQVVFHARIAEEAGEFNIDDIINRICKKMVERHTHVFGDVKADTSDKALANWEAMKKKEKGIKNHTDVLKDVPSNLPALMRSYKVQQKAAEVGFEWNKIEEVFDKLEEEIAELKEAYYNCENIDNITEELGDILFSTVNLSRYLKVHPELALTGTINKFIKRFGFIENEAVKNGNNLIDMTLSEMDELWEKAKIHISEKNG